ncbi:MAG: hydantoinase B/oxoprolinase family protein [Actinomycetota bacterium]|nr:hydantoinase B/oxoprolinase family protein [Actinomycetota bacterium]
MNGRLDPVTLSVLSATLSGIAEEMGAGLIRSAYSSNIKERRDCSAALFDATGRMVAQAEHIPVHLGAMPEAVAAVIECDPKPGDAFIVNDPYTGGTHLPDITIVTPCAHEGELIGYAITRAHHSDVGGMRSGSMPSDSTEVFQEGLVLPPVRLMIEREIVRDVMRILLANVRTPKLRRGDLRAQLAANDLGAERLGELAGRRGLDVVRDAFDEVIAYTDRRTRARVSELPDGEYEAVDFMEGDGASEDDIPIAVRVTVAGDALEIDFDGTADAVAGNVNCPLSVTRSACYFALRVLLPADVPANAGVLQPIEIRARPGSLVNAQTPAAVAAGNVETSQRIADTVLLALSRAVDLPAQGQGTMNNLVIGGRGWTYYETIGGGQGASASGPGASGVHVGMSNTLNTPIEALELEFPLRVERQQLVYDSGGNGQHRGGDGIDRAVRVLEDSSVSLLTDRRRNAPKGLHGGGDGHPGRNLLDGDELPAKTDLIAAAGSVITVMTPGGGGWGTNESGEGPP